jgi:transposase
MDSSRAHALTQIMQIEKQVKKAVNSKRYIKIQEYIRDLKTTQGKAIITIENPYKMGRKIQLRKNSEKAKEYLKQYELLLNEYQILFNELKKRKNHYEAELFS